MPLSTGVKSIAKSGSSGIRGNVTLSEGTNITLTQSGQDISIAAAAGGGSTPQFYYFQPFLNSALSTGVTGTGSLTDTGEGTRLGTGTTANSYAKIEANVPAYPAYVFTGNSQITGRLIVGVSGTDSQFYWGVGHITESGTALTFTEYHYGFKRIRASSVTTWSATNADGTTESATAITPSGETGESEWGAVKTGTTNIKYYENRTLVATHTTNLPTASATTANYFYAILNNANVAANSTLTIRNTMFTQDIV